MDFFVVYSRVQLCQFVLDWFYQHSEWLGKFCRYFSIGANQQACEDGLVHQLLHLVIC